MIKCDKLYILLMIIFCSVNIFSIIWFSLQYDNNIRVNNQYQNYNANITNYNITLNTNKQYDGYVEFTFKNKCLMYNITLSTERAVYYYLNLYYPKYTLMNIYYNKILPLAGSGKICTLSLPYEISSSLTPLVIFVVILILFTLCNCLYYGEKPLKKCVYGT